MLKVGLVGLPNSGKSTLFNALLQRQIAEVAEYPFTTIEPNVGVVQVPDPRLSQIANRLSISKVVPAAIEFIDIAGLVKGANEGEGLGNQFLGHIREVDAVLHLVRGFHNPKVPGELNPKEDIETVNEELKLGEIEKPTIYVVNVDESKLNSELALPAGEAGIRELEKLIRQFTNQPILSISAKLEAELSELSPDEQKAYLKELSVEKSGLEKVIQACYELLGLVTFFTIAGGKQIQAWPLRAGETALAASGLVHTDMEKGFIKAEVIPWAKLVEVAQLRQGFAGQTPSEGVWKTAAEKGRLRLEGRDYILNDGDVVEFKFNL